MNNLTCKEACVIINQIKEEKIKFDDFLSDEDIKKGSEQKKKVQELIEQATKRFTALTDEEKKIFESQADAYFEHHDTLKNRFRDGKEQLIPLYKIQSMIKECDNYNPKEEDAIDWELGMLISLHINAQIKENDVIKIDLRNNENEYKFLGADLSKGKIIILGNAGEYTGNRMIGGEIEVLGDCGSWPGQGMSGGKIIINKSSKYSMHAGSFLNGGEIIIKDGGGYDDGFCMRKGLLTIYGDVYYALGTQMEGGKIEVFGNVEKAGEDMKGGEIIVHGQIGKISIDKIKHGKIIENDVVVVDK